MAEPDTRHTTLGYWQHIGARGSQMLSIQSHQMLIERRKGNVPGDVSVGNVSARAIARSDAGLAIGD